MMKHTIITFLILSSFALCSAQSTKTVKKHKISTRVESVIDYEDGLKNKRVVQEQHFDAAGQLVEFKDFSKDGKIKEWIKYTYTVDGEIATEESFNHKGSLIEKVVYEYQNGLKTKKSYFDHKDRLLKEKIYEYTHY